MDEPRVVDVKRPIQSFGEPLALTALEFLLREIVTTSNMPPVTLEVLTENFFRGVMLDFHSTIYADQISGERVEKYETVEFKHPDGPYQRWRERHSGSWWLRWYVRWRPIKTVEHSKRVTLKVDVSDYAAFPELQRQYPEVFGPLVRKRTTFQAY